jgi:hypothetical protein
MCSGSASVVKPYVMICCGFRSDFEKVLVPVPGDGFGSGRRQYLAQFFTKTLYKILPFQCQQHLTSQKVGLSFFWTFLLHSMLDPDPNKVPVPLGQKVTGVPAVPVPAHQHWDPQPCLVHLTYKNQPNSQLTKSRPVLYLERFLS